MKKEDGELSESPEPYMFVRKDSESNNEADDWDDTQLNKEYDRAIEKAKLQVLRKIKAEMGLTNAEVREVFSELCLGNGEQDKEKKSKKNKQTWAIGDACRTVYSEDGDEYEADIIQLVNHNKCIVNFVGYNNQEEVYLSDLTPSLGKYTRDTQIMAAKIDTAASEDGMDTEDDTSSSTSQIRQSNHQTLPPHNMGNSWNSIDPRLMSKIQRPPMINHCPPPPPPPPPPTLGQCSFNKQPIPTEDDDEALNSMLMSWYMCGYYAGYYQRAIKK